MITKKEDVVKTVVEKLNSVQSLSTKSPDYLMSYCVLFAETDMKPEHYNYEEFVNADDKDFFRN